MMFGSGLVYGVVGVTAAVILGTAAMFKGVTKWPRLRLAGVIASVVLGVATLVLLMFASHVVRVSADLRISEARVIGTATVHSGDRDVELVAHGSGVTLILNESDRPLDVKAFIYGDLQPGVMVAPDEAIEPHSAYTLHANLDYLGPSQRPPSSITTNGPGGKVQYWLTW
jgi:hypothetical protein